MRPDDDAVLVRRFLENRSEAAFRRLYRAHSPYLFALSLRLLGGSRPEAEEALQETWIRAIERLESFRWQSALRTWLAGFAINCCRELRRKSSRGPQPATDWPPSKQPAPPSQARPSERVDLERCLAALPDEQRDVTVLFYVEGYSHDEIAACLGIPAGTSKSRLFQARRQLRSWLDPAGSDREAPS